MKFNIGRINPNIIGEYKNLKYINKPFNDKDTLDKWKYLGHNYEKYTGFMRDQSQKLPKWCEESAKQIPLRNFSVTLYYMTPGTIMPEHSDTFIRYREINKLSSEDNVGRAVLFLENWKSGHYFEVDQTPFINWKKGDYILWKNDTPHIAANLGKENRYTMQVTGIYV